MLSLLLIPLVVVTVIMTDTPQPLRWLTRQQAADVAQVSLRTIAQWIADGELETVKVGRTVRITPQALNDLQARRSSRRHIDRGARRRALRREAGL